MLKDKLQNLGLNKNETLTYLALQELGKSKAGELIQQTGLHRNLVYQALESLTNQRLATKTTTGKVAMFQATDPSHLLDRIREQEIIARNVIEELREKRKINEQEITIYEGAEGMRAFNIQNAEQLKSNEYIHVLGSGGQKFQKAMGPQALKKYFNLLDTNGGTKILMYRDQKFDKAFYEKLQTKPNHEIKIIPNNSTPSAGIVFTNRSVGFHIYEDPISVIEVKNQHLIDAYKSHFEMLWNQDIHIEYGEKAFIGAFWNMLDELEPGNLYQVLGASVGTSAQEPWKKFYDEFHHKRIQKGVRVQMLSYKKALPEIQQRFINEGDPEQKISEIKPLKRTLLSPLQVNLFNNKVLLFVYGDKPTVITLDQVDIYKGFYSYFDELWNHSTE